MHSKKDWKKWKAILLGIDLVLLAATLAAAGWCWKLFRDIAAIPGQQYTQTMAELTARETELDGKIVDRKATLAPIELRAQTAYDTAKAELEAAEAALTALQGQASDLQARIDECQAAIDEVDALRQRIVELKTTYGETVRKLEDMILAGESDYRICYMTFDDGPSYYTERFLNKLDELDAYATFFTIGIQMGTGAEDKRDALLRKEAAAGHSIANHTYTHGIYSNLYNSVDTFMDAVHRQDDVVYNATGFHTDFVRFPAGSYYCKYRKSTIAALEEEGYGWIDWSANACDSGNFDHSAVWTANTVIWMVRQEQISVVLMHDWKLQTLNALETIVTTLREENYVFLPLFKESSTIGTVYPKWDN